MQLVNSGKRLPPTALLVVVVMIAMSLAASPVRAQETSCAGWCPIATFDDLANGSLHTQGPWHVNREGATDGAHAGDDVPVVFSGKTMINRLAGRPPTQYRANAYAELGDLAIEDGSTGTLFLELLTADVSATALNLGLSANPAPGLGADDTGNDLNLGDYEVQLTLDERGFVVRDGGEDRVVDNVDFEDGQLYRIWFVVDNVADTYQVHIASGEQPRVAVESGGVDRFAFRNGTDAALVTYLHINDPEDPPTADSYIDSIYVNPDAESLDDPSPAFDEIIKFDGYEEGELAGQDGWEAAESVVVTGDPAGSPQGRNLALGASTEVSSVRNADTGGDKAVDGLFADESRWMTATTDHEPWIAIDLGEPADLTSIYIYSGLQSQNHPTWSTLKDFTVEVQTEDGWQQVAEVTDNVEHEVAVTGLDIRGDQVRLLISRPSSSTTDIARVFEVEVYGSGDGAGPKVMSMPDPGMWSRRPVPEIPDGATGTVFFRMFRDDLVDTSLGLSAAGAPSTFGDFEVQANSQNSPALNARDGGGFTTAGTWTEGVWQCLWLVADNEADTYRMYSRGGPYRVTTRLPVDEEMVLAFRNGTADALGTFFAINGAASPGTVYVDDIAVDAGGMNLRVPGGDPDSCTATDTENTPIENPVPDVPIDSNLGVTLEELATVPPARDTSPMARINYLGEVPDGSGRLFVPDLYGSMYLLVDGEPVEYLDIAGEFPDFVSAPGLGTGFGFVAFHPGFADNGRFYTVHTEAGAALETATPDLPGPEDAAIHGVVTEWTAADPSSETFSGTRREVLRIGYHTTLHGLQEINFNPAAEPGDEDYGLLYLSSGDGERVPNWTDGPQNLGMPQGKILRIDPLGSESSNGEYGIPATNPFVDQPSALGEVFALGMRNPHRFSWDPADGRMFLGHIGEQSIDSIYEVQAGDNFGWNEREGSYRFDKSDPANVYPLPEDDEQYGFTYPVAELDNPRDSRSVVGGFVYRGSQAPELVGKYVFGDVLTGTIRYIDAADMQRGGDRAQIYNLRLFDPSGEPLELPTGPRGPDMRLGQDSDGELYVLSKTTGQIWKVTGAGEPGFAECEVGDTVVTDVMSEDDWAPVTPDKWQFPGDAVVLAEPGEERPGPRRPFEYAVLDDGPLWGSVQIDAEVQVDVPTPVGRDVIIVFGYQSDTEFYYVHLSEDNASFPHNGIFVVDNADRDRVDDQWNGTTGAPPAIAPGMDWHQVRVRHCAETGQIAVYVDGLDSPLMTATDTTFDHGRVGFGSFDDVGRIRDLTVTGTALGPCPTPDQRSTVVVGDEDSGVENRIIEDGCTINDLILDGEQWDNKGEFIRHVDDVLQTLLPSGVIDAREASAIRRAAARSDVGEPRTPHGVVPVDWNQFDDGLPTDDAAELSREIMLNTNRYALMSWYDERGFSAQTGRYLDLGGTSEHFVRPVGSMAQALATSLATGAYDEDLVGFSERQARETAVRLTTSLAYHHKANRPGGWGDAWQSALWASSAGFAGWLLWDDLSAEDQALVERMVVHEADRFLHYEVPYYQAPDGTILTPGDTKAEENAWNAFMLTLAASMLPEHPNWAVWQDKAIELMVSAYARPSDLDDDTELNGKPVSEWLNGSNINENGTLINHSRVHPDYFTSITNSTTAPLVYSLAGQPTPQASFFNADIVYQALVDLEFESPPYDPPGGTIYVRGDDGEATADAYYPQGNDWGTSRQMHFMHVDTQADLFGFDEHASIPAREWAKAHATRAIEMQERHDDRRTYADPEEDTFQSREEWVARQAARAYLAHWLVHQDAVEMTDQAYPVTPGDYPGATLDLETERNYPPGEAAPVTVQLESQSDAPLTQLSFDLAVPDGWEAQLDGVEPATLPPGESASITWLVTPDPDAEEGNAELVASASYLHYGRARTLEAVTQVAVGEWDGVVLSDDGAPFYVETGTWGASPRPGFDGSGSRYAPIGGGAGNGETATWTPVLPEAGSYRVYVWYPADTSRGTTAATYTVAHAAGSTDVVVNQRENGDSWNLLGTWEFGAGADASVTLTVLPSATGYHRASAVRFEAVTE